MLQAFGNKKKKLVFQAFSVMIDTRSYNKYIRGIEWSHSIKNCSHAQNVAFTRTVRKIWMSARLLGKTIRYPLCSMWKVYKIAEIEDFSRKNAWLSILYAEQGLSLLDKKVIVVGKMRWPMSLFTQLHSRVCVFFLQMRRGSWDETFQTRRSQNI